MTMQHNDDAFATMLLMSQINPSREELVRPLSTTEWHRLRAAVSDSELTSLGGLLRADMSELMFALNCTEEEAYRLCVLLGRTLPLSILLEQFQLSGIDVMTYEERAYPERLRGELAEKAPPMLYLVGRPELFRQPAIAILGALGARGDAEGRVRSLVRGAVDAGYVIITDGQNGLGQIAMDELKGLPDGRAIMVLGGGMVDMLSRPLIPELVQTRRLSMISQFHPEAPFTLSHANQRNRCLYALAQAAFVVGCDEEKGSTWAGAVEALRAKWCRFVYVLDTDLYPGNRALIQRGALPMPDLDKTPFEQMCGYWQSAQAEQICLFDWDQPKMY